MNIYLCIYVVKYLYRSTDILWRVFHILTCAHTPLLHRFMYTEPVPFKYGKLATKYFTALRNFAAYTACDSVSC